MAPRKYNKTDPRNKATPVDQLRGAAKQARINRVTRAEAGPRGIGASPMTSAGATGRPSGSRTPAIRAQGMSRPVSRLGIPMAIAAEVLKPRPTAKAELTPAMKQRYYEENKGRRQIEIRNQQMRADKGSFDDAFSAARQAGRKDFTWRGRKYNTKMKGE